MNTIRAFIAVSLPADVEAALGDVAGTLGERLPGGAVRWVRSEQIHLTLRFLGDTALDGLPAIMGVMDGTAGMHAPFTLRLDGVGCFPNTRRPRVVWVGLSGDNARLDALKKDLDGHLAPLGWPPEDKAFRAHLTLGRVKDEQNVTSIDWMVDVPRLDVHVTAIHLIESRLTPAGPIYTVCHSSHLG